MRLRKPENHRSRGISILTIAIIVTGLSFPAAGQITPVVYAEGFNSPVCITNAGDDRLFVVERGGIVRIVTGTGNVESTPFLDISDIITAGGERGLLGLAFHPGFDENGYFFVNYTDLDGNTVVARYSVSVDDPDMADPESGTVILEIDQPYSNHNGGDLNFGPDGYLYIGTGDGGSGGDPDGNAQNLTSLLGKMLRIDVDGGTPYAIPADNPYADGLEGAPEVWASGLRNPWRFSFDRETGDLWIGDVGQSAVEEIDLVPAGKGSGLNFGWRCYEGTLEYNTENCGAAGEYEPPVYQYLHNEDDGCSVTGGYVYRGMEFPSLNGHYIFSDYCNDIIYTLQDSTGQWLVQKHGPFTGNRFSTFGEDGNGELYLAGLTSGTIYKITSEEAQTGISVRSTTPWIIYPNPAGDHISVASRTEAQTPERIRILNGAGMVVLDLNIGLFQGAIDISRIVPGVYIIEISNADRTMYDRLIRTPMP